MVFFRDGEVLSIKSVFIRVFDGSVGLEELWDLGSGNKIILGFGVSKCWVNKRFFINVYRRIVMFRRFFLVKGWF